MKIYNSNLPKFTDLDNIIDSKVYHALTSNNKSELINSKELVRDGLYIIKTKKFDNNIIIYNYLYFANVFTNSILKYISTRLNSPSHLKRECGDYTLYLDTTDLNISDFGYKAKDSFILNNVDIRQEIEFLDYTNVELLIKILLNVNINKEGGTIAQYIDELYKNKIYNIFSSLFGKDSMYQDREDSIKKTIASNIEILDYHLIDNSVFVTKNLKEFTGLIGELGYSINQGVQSKRGEVSNMSNFLSNWGLDYRNSLYINHVNQIEKGNWSRNFKLDRNLFSFRNINMKLSGVRYYSTDKRIVSNKGEMKNMGRQVFTENNYRIISDILKNNYYVGNEKTQLKIENTLYNQEIIFAQDNLLKIKLNYNEKAFLFIKESKETLEKLLNRMLDVNKSTNTTKNIQKSTKNRTIKNKDNTNYREWTVKMINVIGIENIVYMLLEYLMKVLTCDIVEEEEIHTPGIPLVQAFEEFGKKLVHSYIWTLYNGHDGKNDISYSVYKHRNKNLFTSFTEDLFNPNLGGYFINALLESELLIQELDKKANPSSEKNKYAETEHWLRVPAYVKSIMSVNNKIVFHLPQKLPMVCEPKDYVYSTDKEMNILGGYLLNDVKYDDEIFKTKRGYPESTILRDENIVVSLINGLSKTPYRVNKETLDFIREYGIEKEIIIDISNNQVDKILNTQYKDMTLKDKNNYLSIKSQIVLERNILNIAECYSEVERIYFPVRLDQRTRLYCETDYFDYQKNDLAKGLISFAEPGNICKTWTESINYFKAYGANMYGKSLDKKSMAYRVKWIDDNQDYILNFRDNDIINNAENKTSFVSFCFEYEKFINFMESMNESVFYTHLPIRLDASCNGFQHLALLTKEFSLFNKLNLSESSQEDDPNDFYSHVLRKTKTFIKNEIINLSNKDKDLMTEKDIRNLNSLVVLDKISFDRSVVKKVIMTKSYNAGLIKQVDQIKNMLTPDTEEYWEDNKKRKRTIFYYKDPEIHITRYDITRYVTSLRTVLDNESPKVKELSEYISGIVRVCAKLGTGIPWVLPSGAEIRETYERKEKLPPLKSFNFLKTKFTFQRFLKNTIDYKKLKRATMPNLIHSLDATTIAMLYNNFGYKKSLFTVHDCFATTANHVPSLMYILKLTYLDLYSNNDYLKQFDSFVKTTINNMFGDQVYKFNDKHVYVPDKNSVEVIPFPDVDKVLKMDPHYKDNVSIDSIQKASYLLI